MNQPETTAVAEARAEAEAREAVITARASRSDGSFAFVLEGYRRTIERRVVAAIRAERESPQESEADFWHGVDAAFEQATAEGWTLPRSMFEEGWRARAWRERPHTG